MAFPGTLVSWLPPLLAQQPFDVRSQILGTGTSTLSWIAGVALLGLIFALLMAPSFEVKLNKKIVSAAVTAGFLLSLSLVFGNALPYSPNDREGVMILNTLSGGAAGLGLFFLVMASARFALSQGPPEGAQQDHKNPV